MNKTYKNFIFLFVVVISTLLYFLNKYNNIIEQNEIDIFVSNQVELVQQELTNQKNQALSLAILFSKNQNIIDNLEQDKPKELKKEILKLLEIIKTYSNQNNLQVQIHTKDLKVFVRSWEDKDSGLSLESFRKGLVKVKETKEPYVSNELGKRFNIKAIAPICKAVIIIPIGFVLKATPKAYILTVATLILADINNIALLILPIKPSNFNAKNILIAFTMAVIITILYIRLYWKISIRMHIKNNI